MQRARRVVLFTLCLASLVLASLPLNVRAEEPAKKAEAVKPPWQRLLQAADAKTAGEQE